MKNPHVFNQGKNVQLRIGSGADGLYPQELFRDLLIHERKRSERSKRQLFFVALDIKDILTSTRADVGLVGRIIKSINKASREIDIKGWYETSVCIGIIYTEILPSAYEKILVRIRQKLMASLSNDVVARIGITYTSYPETDGKQWTQDRGGEILLYPPLAPKTPWKKTHIWLKRFLDIAGSAFGIIIFSPLLMIVALLIKVTSPGPVIFKQERIGLGGKRFTIFKFRSMQAKNDSTIHQDYVKKLIVGQAIPGETGKNATYKIQNDPRVTLIGRFIRATSIDELPQLFNVLAGDMSLVGPRPSLAYEVEVYETWHRRRIVEVKPGITGLWQVEGRSKTTFDGMVRMDLDYIRNWTIWMDVKLLLKTPAAVVTTKGAY